MCCKQKAFHKYGLWYDSSIYQMLFQSKKYCKSLSTGLTNTRMFTCMCKDCSACAANKRLLPSVDSGMILQVIRCCKDCSACDANERLLTSMNPVMFFQSRKYCKSLSTGLTNKRLFTSMVMPCISRPLSGVLSTMEKLHSLHLLSSEDVLYVLFLKYILWCTIWCTRYHTI